MARLINLCVTFFCVGLVVFSMTVGLKTGGQNSFYSRLENTQGEVIAFEAGLIVVEFNGDVINTCGDTNIYGFITGPSGFSLQLKPVFIPSAKAESVNTSILVFPIWDVISFLTESGDYTLEFFVDNNCSLLHNKTITLPPITVKLGEAGVNV